MGLMRSVLHCGFFFFLNDIAPILKTRKIEVQRGWGGRALKVEVTGQEGRAQSSLSSSGRWEEVGDGRPLGVPTVLLTRPAR